MTVAELRTKAKNLGLKGYSKLNKAQLEELIGRKCTEPQEVSGINKEETPAPEVLEVKPVNAPTTYRKTRLVRSIYNFSSCKDEKILRKALNSGSVEAVEGIARSFPQFQPLTGKRMTKKFFIDFIVGLYFPKKQEDPAPVQEVKTQEVHSRQGLRKRNFQGYRGKLQP